MRQWWKALTLVFVATVMLADVYLDYRASLGQQNTPVERSGIPVGINTGELAPDFTGITIDGQEIRLSELRGKTVLINIFASWCGPCRVEAPHLVEVHNGLDAEEVVFIGLNLEETSEAVAGFQADFGIEFPLVLNQDGRLTEIYTPRGLPTSWFIDADGVIQYVHAGPITAEMLQQALADVQAGRQPDPFAAAG